MIQKSLFYITEKERRKSFRKWIFSDKESCNANKVSFKLLNKV